MRLLALTTAALLLTTALTAHADPAAGMPGAGGPLPAERLAEMKSRMMERHQQFEAFKAERRAAHDALDAKCFGAMQAATSRDAMRAAHEECRSERQALHAKFQAERQQHRLSMRGGMGEMPAPGALAAK